LATDRELLLLIEPVDELVVGRKTLATQQLVQPPVAEPAALAGKGTQALAEAGMVVGTLGLALHHRTREADQPAGTTAREPMLLLSDGYSLPPYCRRHQFFASRPLSA